MVLERVYPLEDAWKRETVKKRPQTVKLLSKMYFFLLFFKSWVYYYFLKLYILDALTFHIHRLFSKDLLNNIIPANVQRYNIIFYMLFLEDLCRTRKKKILWFHNSGVSCPWPFPSKRHMCFLCWCAIVFHGLTRAERDGSVKSLGEKTTLGGYAPIVRGLQSTLVLQI